MAKPENLLDRVNRELTDFISGGTPKELLKLLTTPAPKSLLEQVDRDLSRFLSGDPYLERGRLKFLKS